ncbi:AraC family transcriptional regulator [Streptomyces sp. NPDC047315]|uniref:AraC family transcriptional regulator n=1 Tax=Streptomyces sp. NPDC047315 TaxID=3155142 RepID=UPI0033DCDE31
MDVLAGLLDGPRARGACLLRMVMEPPWSVLVQEGASLSLMCMTRGEAWVVPEAGEPVLLRPGDAAVTRGPTRYTLADSRTTEPRTFIAHDGSSRTLRGDPLTETRPMGVRTWGNDPDGSAVMQVGTYRMEGEVSRPLLDALPPLLHLPADAWNWPLLPVLDEEIARDGAGQDAVLDRALDLVLVSALRAWFSRPEASAPAWYRAMGDPVVGRALRLVRDDPAHPWTVASLAAKCGVSRAGLARRFHDLVGEPPMTYLTRHRLDLAADLLREPGATLDSIARKVGYSRSSALSNAFQRVRGISPQAHRGRISTAASPDF